jgi:hypothetical protein
MTVISQGRRLGGGSGGSEEPLSLSVRQPFVTPQNNSQHMVQFSYLVGTDAFSSKATTIGLRVWGCGLGREMDRDIPPNKPSLC